MDLMAPSSDVFNACSILPGMKDCKGHASQLEGVVEAPHQEKEGEGEGEVTTKGRATKTVSPLPPHSPHLHPS